MVVSAFVFTFQAAYSELAMCVKRVSEDAYEYANKSISVVSIDGVQNVSFLVKGSTETVQFTGSEISSIEASVFLSSGSECTESARLSPIAAFSNGSAEMTPYAAASAAALCAKFSSSVWYNFAIALPVVSIETDKSYVATINTPVSIEISGENLGIFCPSTENVKLNDDEAFRSATTVACTSCAPEVASVSQLDSEFSMTLSESNVMDITFARRHHVESIVLSVPENVITSPKSVKLYAKRSFDENDLLTYTGAGIALGIFGFLVAGLVNDSSVSVMTMFYGLLGLGIAINMILSHERTPSL